MHYSLTQQLGTAREIKIVNGTTKTIEARRSQYFAQRQG